ncbi:hypothetical protein [Phosphitispora fastidiosa]|uniref:hypothetical protein n=1 Tax=Phosphitispora fastidiosa TaxID=2837202 RepID=UPI001E61EE18|nr:hypothetical protein [Phosphitispora fastidiosa]MBU7007934.1 hypothetical protein [Phosphitispora fastidiosa]
MRIYHHKPYLRITVYVFTIVFHANLLARAVLESRYWIGAALFIPVTAISLALIKYVRRTVTAVYLNDLEITVKTLFRHEKSEIDAITVKGREIISRDGKRFVFNPRRGGLLTEKLGTAGGRAGGSGD